MAPGTRLTPRGTTRRQSIWTCASPTCATALDERAAPIYCPARTLLHLPTWADRRRVFERVAASLRPGGGFAWNAFLLDHDYAARAGGVRVAEPGAAHRPMRPAESRLDIVMESGATSSLWLATKSEWLGLIDVSGLELSRSSVAAPASR